MAVTISGLHTSAKVADRASFANSFAQSVQTYQPLLAYARLGSKALSAPHVQARGEGEYDHTSSSAMEVLFEIRARVHVVPSSGVACVFAVASPYPSRTTAMYGLLLCYSIFTIDD